ncbi:MAG TPA: hypothetical protein VLT90_11365 [Terriglobales bacterium]|nr:hypothetical protein [Terriglobales bacterium]
MRRRAVLPAATLRRKLAQFWARIRDTARLALAARSNNSSGVSEAGRAPRAPEFASAEYYD